ncbi:MAG: NfeD family protein [Candidatus Calescibacterium sp.]|nr:NfeD family protein [Candidatus Calescibacterium sp.]MCX7971679.1 NfeD family protein [bacterium]MDW8195285.1 NfeD family protein [Candidatus Calescibacterium sp.]
MIFIPIVILIGIILIAYFFLGGESRQNILIWIYLIISLGSAGLLFLLLVVGLFDLGGDGGGIHHGSGGDGGVIHHDSGGDVAGIGGGDTAVHNAVSHDSGAPPLILSPSAFLIISALYGSFGVVTLSILSFLPEKIRDFSSIILSALLAGLTYAYVIRILFKFLRTTSMVKTTSYYEGKEAEVLYDIPYDGFGKINVRTEDKMEQLLAKSEDGSYIPAGSIVRIKKHMGTFVIVEKIN